MADGNGVSCNLLFIRWEARATNMILVSTSWNSAHITDTIIENGFFVWMVGNYDYL